MLVADPSVNALIGCVMGSICGGGEGGVEV